MRFQAEKKHLWKSIRNPLGKASVERVEFALILILIFSDSPYTMFPSRHINIRPVNSGEGHDKRGLIRSSGGCSASEECLPRRECRGGGRTTPDFSPLLVTDRRGCLAKGMEEGAHRSRWDVLQAARTPPPPFAGEGRDGPLHSRHRRRWGRRIAVVLGAACMLLLVQPASPLPLGPGPPGRSGSPGYGAPGGGLNPPSGLRSVSPSAMSRSGSPAGGPGEVVCQNGVCRLVPLSQSPPPLVAGGAGARGIAALAPGGCGACGGAVASPVGPRSWQPWGCCETGRGVRRSGDEEGRRCGL